MLSAFPTLCTTLCWSQSEETKQREKVSLLKCLPPHISKTHVVLSSEGVRQSRVSGGTQRNHRAFLSPLPRSLNYSLKPPEFLPNKILQSATQRWWSHTDTPPDQTAGVGSGALSCNIEKSETECFSAFSLFFFFLDFWNLCYGEEEVSTFSLRGLIGKERHLWQMIYVNMNSEHSKTGSAEKQDI